MNNNWADEFDEKFNQVGKDGFGYFPSFKIEQLKDFIRTQITLAEERGRAQIQIEEGFYGAAQHEIGFKAGQNRGLERAETLANEKALEITARHIYPEGFEKANVAIEIASAIRKLKV